MSNDLIHIYNHETGETEVREMTDQEQETRDADVAAAIAAKEFNKAESAQKETAREAILDRLGLTADEAAILLG
jgi:hypothetical protein